MDYSNIVTVGDKVHLTKYTGINEQTESHKQYVSQVLDLMDDAKAAIAMPLENGRVIPLSVGEKYDASFFTGKGIYKCTVEILDRYKEDNLYVLLVQFVSEFEKYQRRQFFRLNMLKNVEFRLVTPQEMIIEKKLNEDNFESEITKHKFINTLNALRMDWCKGTATDLSGGGMRFNAHKEKEKNDSELFIRLNFSVGDKEFDYELKAEIINVSSMPNKTGYFEYRIKFEDITKEQRENIIKYIFEEERKRRKKDLF